MQVFISYKSEERARVAELVEGLGALGIRVWWDKELPPGGDWQERIDSALMDSSLIVVVWTQASVKSRFVRAEAQLGFDEQKLLPVRLEDVRLPVPFNIVETTDLKSSPLTQDANWNRIASHIQSVLGTIGASEDDGNEPIEGVGANTRVRPQPVTRDAANASVSGRVIWPSIFTALGCAGYLMAIVLDTFSNALQEHLGFAVQLNGPLLIVATLLIATGFVGSTRVFLRPLRST